MPAAEVTLAHKPNVTMYPQLGLAVINLHLICNEYQGVMQIGITAQGIEYFTAAVQRRSFEL